MSIAMAKVRANRINRNMEQYKPFIEACVTANREHIIFSIQRMGNDHVDTIIDSFCSTLLGNAFVSKNQEQLIDLIKGGSLFSIHKQLEESFRNDTAISESIQAVERGDVAF